MAMEKQKQLVPKLRFVEFADEPTWDVKPLGHLATRRTKRNGDGSKLRTLTNSAEYGVVDQREYFEKDIATNTENYFVVETGDYVYNPRVSNIAPVGPISKNRIGTGVMSPLYTVFRFSNDKHDYFSHYFASSHWHGFLRKVSNSGARHDRMAISNNDLLALPIAVPPTEAEQQKIADCLGSLDDLIDAESRKLEALRAHKKGLMQQLFPQPGETVPRLRFPEFQNAGEWEEKKISELCSLKAGDFIPATEIEERKSKGKYPCYGGNGLRGYVESFNHDGRYVLIGRQGALCGNVNLCEGKFQATEHALVASVFGKFEVDFVYHAFDALQLNRFATGQAQPGLSVCALNDILLRVPNDPNEQRIVASCLTSVDVRSIKQSQKFEGLKLHKRGLLQQLFPSVEGNER
ncbi:restriction endonuclease subunit S [Notoacmeibacter ruber]|uniref:Restriction endonuclease subunit S n=1 Tax=Notoacmeibacter ruber TaxID=2670375 RepID=A0A3L7JFM3_9HYPH|nr:restriction endonuclease subunit S [Notoacmeibacter ruber]RLQ89280.1 restriction endonuclease subunit S [Notoacmeibacter ruber]